MRSSTDFTDYMPALREYSIVYRDYLKRILDIVLSLSAIIVTIVPMIIISIWIKLDSRGPVIFKQKRIGKKGKVFDIYKFRSMYIDSEHTGSGVYSDKNDDRVTRIGRVLRASSMDEFPQFFNILFGDMSFIGPRPPLTYHPWTIDKYTDEQLHMFDVRPGMSGWAQMHGGREVEWNHRIELNLWYISHVRLELDVKIVFMTLYNLLFNKRNRGKQIG